MRLVAVAFKIFRHFCRGKSSNSSQPNSGKWINSRAHEQRYLGLLQACNSISLLSQIHAHILKFGLQDNALVLTKFSAVCSSLDAIDYASNFIFSSESNFECYDAFLFNTIIRGYAQSYREKRKAASVFLFMQRCGVFPNKFTFPFLLKASAGISDLCLGKNIHGSALKFGFGCDLHVHNTLIYMYSSCEGGFESASQLLEEMPMTCTVSWSAMIGGCVRSGRSNDAISVFRKMQLAGVKPDEITMISVLSACADLGTLELGKWIGSYIEREKIQQTVALCNALIDMFTKCGSIEEGLRVFNRMDTRTIVSWTSLINGFAMHGRGFEAIETFEKMTSQGIPPDDVSFIGVLSACSHAGLVNEGCRYFDAMKEFSIVPKIEHYGCMVDLFGRAGLVDRAVEFVQRMPIEPNQIILRMLIGSCRAHGKFDLGERISTELIGDEPNHSSNYVLLSNIYALMNQWDKKRKIRKEMDKRKVRKLPGCTLIELNNEIYEFIAGDKTHPQYKEIDEMVEEVMREIKKAGYVLTTSEMLLDIDEEDKEDALHRHSEKLAIAFALLNTKPGTSIRIMKNLRVCGDCHSATKFISKVYNREIIVRDRNRFHHFHDGRCSCKDFW